VGDLQRELGERESWMDGWMDGWTLVLTGCCVGVACVSFPLHFEVAQDASGLSVG
jgi:hypothetical protein